MLIMNRNHFSDIPIFLENFLIMFNDKKSLAICVSFSVFSVLTIFAVNVSIFYTGFMNSLKSALFFGTIGTVTLTVHIYILLNQKTLKRFLYLLKMMQKMRKEEWEIEMFHAETDRIWRLYYWYCEICSIYCIWYFVMPYIGDFVLGYFLPDSPSIRLPLAGQGFIDNTEPRSLSNFFVSAIGVFYIIAVFLPFTATEGFLLFSMIYTRTELKLLNRKITIVKYGFVEGEKWNVNKKLLYIIKQHQFFLKVLKSLNAIVGFPVFIKYMTVSFCFCLNLFSILKALTLAEYGGLLVPTTSIASVGSLLLILCNVGESLQTENTKLSVNLYNLPWYQFKPKHRKTLDMVLRQVKKPCYVNFHGIINLNLKTYMQVINSSYSYFMLLKSRIR